MKHLALTIATGLLLAVAIWHVQANAPRDWPEHALAWVCRMTFNDSGGSVASRNRSDTKSKGEPGPKQALAIPAHIAEMSGRSAQTAAVTYVLRMLGLPRMRANVELRD